MMPKTKNSTGIKVMLKRHKPNDSSKKPRDVTARTMNTQSKFVAHSCKGENVEVKSDEEGYQGAWYILSLLSTLGRMASTWWSI